MLAEGILALDSVDVDMPGQVADGSEALGGVMRIILISAKDPALFWIPRLAPRTQPATKPAWSKDTTMPGAMP